MVYLSQIYTLIKKGFWLVVLYLMIWQQWNTLLRYQDKFLNPIQFTKQNLGFDFYSQYGNRFVEVKKFFTSPTRLYYIGEPNVEFGISEAYFALTQYYLAPNLILRNNVVCDTILYNLYNSIHINAATNFHLNNGWHVVKDFNNGLIILAK